MSTFINSNDCIITPSNTCEYFKCSLFKHVFSIYNDVKHLQCRVSPFNALNAVCMSIGAFGVFNAVCVENEFPIKIIIKYWVFSVCKCVINKECICHLMGFSIVRLSVCLLLVPVPVPMPADVLMVLLWVLMMLYYHTKYVFIINCFRFLFHECSTRANINYYSVYDRITSLVLKSGFDRKRRERGKHTHKLMHVFKWDPLQLKSLTMSNSYCFSLPLYVAGVRITFVPSVRVHVFMCVCVCILMCLYKIFNFQHLLPIIMCCIHMKYYINPFSHGWWFYLNSYLVRVSVCERDVVINRDKFIIPFKWRTIVVFEGETWVISMRQLFNILSGMCCVFDIRLWIFNGTNVDCEIHWTNQVNCCIKTNFVNKEGRGIKHTINNHEYWWLQPFLCKWFRCVESQQTLSKNMGKFQWKPISKYAELNRQSSGGCV